MHKTRSIKLNVMTLAAIIVLTILLYGCATEQNLWEKTLDNNTIDAYVAFLLEYPDGEYAEEAKETIDKLSWDIARNTNSIKSYKHYLDQHPDGKFLEMAEESIDNMSWSLAASRNTVESYERYLEDFPEGRFAGDANYDLFKKNIAIASHKQGIEEAAVFNKNEPGPHKLVIIKVIPLNKHGEFDKRWNLILLDEWRAKSVSETELILLFREKWAIIESKEYRIVNYSDGLSISPIDKTRMVNRTQHEIYAELIIAKTGEILATKTFRGSEPDPFPDKLPTFTIRIKGVSEASAAEIVKWLTPVVRP